MKWFFWGGSPFYCIQAGMQDQVGWMNPMLLTHKKKKKRGELLTEYYATHETVATP